MERGRGERPVQRGPLLVRGALAAAQRGPHGRQGDHLLEAAEPAQGAERPAAPHASGPTASPVTPVTTRRVPFVHRLVSPGPLFCFFPHVVKLFSKNTSLYWVELSISILYTFFSTDVLAMVSAYVYQGITR